MHNNYAMQKEGKGEVRIHQFGDPSASIVLIQPEDKRNLAMLESEAKIISEYTAKDFCLLAVGIEDWNYELSPWEAPAVFGKEDFGSGAPKTLEAITELCADMDREYYIGGYSLAGLFALWTVYQTDIFKGVAAASPSMWFPGFVEYMKRNKVQSDIVYLSLGDKEPKTRNPVMATVGDRIQQAYGCLKDSSITCVLDWNQGNHFKEPDLRTAKAFAWVLNQ